MECHRLGHAISVLRGDFLHNLFVGDLHEFAFAAVQAMAQSLAHHITKRIADATDQIIKQAVLRRFGNQQVEFHIQIRIGFGIIDRCGGI